MTIYLDGSKMTDKESLHIHLAEKFGFPNYYGKNLDALWDLLMVVTEKDFVIVLTNWNMVKERLGEYGEKLLRTFYLVAQEKDNISFVLQDEE